VALDQSALLEVLDALTAARHRPYDTRSSTASSPGYANFHLLSLSGHNAANRETKQEVGVNPSGSFVVMAELDLNTGYAPDWFPDSVWTDLGDAYDRLEYLRTLPMVLDVTMIPAPLDRLELARKQQAPYS
jgi:hypothetical protein